MTAEKQKKIEKDNLVEAKVKGNAFFRNKDYINSLKQYELVLSLIKSKSNPQDFQQIKVDVLSNCSLVSFY